MSFLRACASDDLVSEASLERLVERETLVSLEMAIQDAVLSFGQTFQIRKRPFTKTARSRLKLIGCRDSALPVELIHLLARESVTVGLLEPNKVVSLLNTGERAAGLLLGEFNKSVHSYLPEGIGLEVDQSAMMLVSHSGIRFDMNLPEDDSASSHALRMAVMNTLHAMSMGMIFFNHPQLMFDPDFGICYVLQEVWDTFRTSINGKSVEAIEEMILDINLEDLEVELYFLGVEEAVELHSNPEALRELALILHELDTFARLYGIDTSAYDRGMPEACEQQIDMMHGQAERYPEHAQVYQVLIGAMRSVADHNLAGKTYSGISDTVAVQNGSENLEGVMPLMQGVFVLPSYNFCHLGEIVDQSINNDIDSSGYPAIAFEYGVGVVTQTLKPMIEVIAEANSLLTKIMNVLKEVENAG
ncbi:hypothetical protein QAO71_17825 (plasmid) [Halopseudomonas sp. SMJS2]|uniref:hypothetical protein n=1 Tax=Halopseudomonas sp. SMJS2 TaxID=3041098 RepID=UPI0024536850|nr:hypothetical protein [Halopseudomonas sp. SMJS2]WGK63401.1 hypothetical protein QAO71_17825 [Halopseudomonas sp. SMJS2]